MYRQPALRLEILSGFGKFLSRDLLQIRIGFYRYIRWMPMSRIDPSGLYDDEVDDTLDSVQDILIWMKDHLNDKEDLTDSTPTGLKESR